MLTKRSMLFSPSFLPIQSLFGLYRTTLLEHNDPPRCMTSASKFVRAIEVTNKNKLRNVGGIRFDFLCVILVISSMARPIASDSFVDVC